MQKQFRLLEKPISQFSTDSKRYRKVFRYSVADSSPFFWETDCLLVTIISGCGTAVVNQVSYPISVGDVGVLHSYHVFAFYAESGTTLELELTVYPYPQMVLMSFGSFSDAYIREHVFFTLEPQHMHTFRNTLQALKEEYAKQNCSQLVCNCLLGQLNRLALDGSPYKVENMPACANLFYDLAFSSFQPISLEVFSNSHGLSGQQVNRELRKICLSDFYSALNHARLSNAYSMILRNNLPIGSLAAESGFPSESTFYRIFKDYFGVSPHEYKETLKLLLNMSSQNMNENSLGIESYILNNFRDNISCSSCAKRLFLSQEAVNLSLKEKYGPTSTFTAFLTSVRLRYSEGLLSMTDVPVIDVALDSGFNSVHTFIRLFKKQYRCTPTEFRNKMKRGTDSW